jgi:hypothetical protein
LQKQVLATSDPCNGDELTQTDAVAMLFTASESNSISTEKGFLSIGPLFFPYEVSAGKDPNVAALSPRVAQDF